MPHFDPPVINEALTQNAAKVAGLVERVTYHNAENGFCVLRLKVRGHRDLVTVVGHAPSVTAGEYATALGAWVADREYGRQLKDRFSISRLRPRSTALKSISAPAW